MNEEFVSLKEAAEELKVNRMTLYRRIKKYDIPVFQDPHDQRYRMIRLEDFETLKNPPIVEVGKEVPAHNLAA